MPISQKYLKRADYDKNATSDITIPKDNYSFKITFLNTGTDFVYYYNMFMNSVSFENLVEDAGGHYP